MRFWSNLLGYQAAWFANVYAAAHGFAWAGIAAALLFALAQWSASAHKRNDTRLMAIALVAGMAIDGGLSRSGWLKYASAVPALAAPLWILAMWVAFAMTINHSLAFLRGRAGIAALLGGIGAPLAYLGAARGFEAVAFATPRWQGLLALSLGWAIALPLLAKFAAHGQSGARPASIAREREA